MMLLMQRNRRSDFEGREHYGVRYDMPRSRYIEPYGYDEPLSYYDERIHGREPEMRRYSNGRFAPRNSAEWPEYDDMPASANRDMRPIGFRDGSTSYVGDETRGTEKRMGYAKGEGARLNRQTAEKWVRGMKNADGSTGEHWTMEQFLLTPLREGRPEMSIMLPPKAPFLLAPLQEGRQQFFTKPQVDLYDKLLKNSHFSN